MTDRTSKSKSASAGQRGGNARPIPPISGRDMPIFGSEKQRRKAGDAFGDQLGTSDNGADGYHSVRPGYPLEVLDFIRHYAGSPGDSQIRAADVGAGTGKLTRALLDEGFAVTAIDPSSSMRNTLSHTCPDATIIAGSAESMPTLGNSSMDLITCAQTWHWVDAEQASAEFARVLRPGGTAILTWNTLDVRIPWIHRLTRIMHAGDVQRPNFVPEVCVPLNIIADCRTTWDQHLTPEQIILLARTRSYWLNAKAPTRRKVEANLQWYLYEHLGFTIGEPVALTYRSDSFAAEME